MTKKKLIIVFLTLLIIGSGLFITTHSLNFFTSEIQNSQFELTREEIENKLKELEKDEYEDGTYNLQTLEIVSYSIGYQVTFCQIGDDYSDEDFLALAKRFQNESIDGIISAGKYNGETEISFNIQDKETAISLAIEFNQASIWDWSAGSVIETGGTGKR